MDLRKTDNAECLEKASPHFVIQNSQRNVDLEGYSYDVPSEKETEKWTCISSNCLENRTSRANSKWTQIRRSYSFLFLIFRPETVHGGVEYDRNRETLISSGHYLSSLKSPCNCSCWMKAPLSETAGDRKAITSVGIFSQILPNFPI